MSGVVLLCVDGSPASTAATRVALEIARAHRAEVVALHVVEDGAIAALVDRAIDGHDADARLAAAGEALLARTRQAADDAGVTIRCETELGEPFEHILDRARALHPSFVVMGRSGRRGPGRALLGSEVEHVLEFTEWPVVVVPSP